MKLLSICLALLVPFAVCAQSKSYDITAYGAKQGKKNNSTAAVQKAIDEASQNGGGKVVIPAGQFVTGPIVIKSGVNLYLSKGAELLGSTVRKDYGLGYATPLISADGQKDIAITGPGTIDGQGKELLDDLFRLLKNGEIKDATWQKFNPWGQKQPEERNRPIMIAFKNCRDIKITGVSIKNGIDWIQDYKFCENMIIDSINVESNVYWNNDGIDIVDCKNVRLTNSFFNADDDGICLKSEDRNHYCDQIYVANCKVRSSASAIKFGTASHGGFKNITIKDVEIYDTFRSAIALEVVDGGFMEKVDIRNVNARNTGNAIFIRVGHRNKDTVSSTLKDIYIGNVNVQIPKGKPDKGYPMEGPIVPGKYHVFPSVIAGLADHPVQNVTLENINVTYAGGYDKKIPTVGLDTLERIPENVADYPEFSMFGELPAWGMYVRHAENIAFKNVNFSYEKADLRPAMVFHNVKGLKLDRLALPKAETLPAIVLKDVKGFSKEGLQLPAAEDKAIKEIK